MATQKLEDPGASDALAQLACEVTDALCVVAPRGWTRADLSLDRVGDQLRVAKVDTELPAAPLPMPQLGMDPGERMAGLAAALTDALHLLHARGVDWSGARATLQREGMERLVMTLHQPSGPPAASVSVPRALIDALFLAEPFLAALAEAEPRVAEQARAWEERLLGVSGWKLDQRAAQVTFDIPNVSPVVVRAELLGTWTPHDDAWLWAWANSSVDPACTKTVEAKLAPQTQPSGMAALWREKFPCEEPFAHRMAGMAAVRVGASGMYRGGFGRGGFAYLALFD